MNWYGNWISKMKWSGMAVELKKKLKFILCLCVLFFLFLSIKGATCLIDASGKYGVDPSYIRSFQGRKQDTNIEEIHSASDSIITIR